jgi:hypothetical protein
MKSTKLLRAQIERRQAATLWGQKHFITPRLLDHIFGDGRKLIWVSGINTRPAYWVVRADSSYCLDNHWSHDDCGLKHPCDWLEDIYQAIEEEFGTGEKPDGSLYARARFPEACDLGAGSFWGPHKIRRPAKVGRVIEII